MVPKAFSVSVPFFLVISSLVVGSLVVGLAFGSPSTSWSWVSSIYLSYDLINLEDVNIVRMTVMVYSVNIIMLSESRGYGLALGMHMQLVALLLRWSGED